MVAYGATECVVRGGRQVLRSALHNAVGKANVADVQLCVARGEWRRRGLHSSHRPLPPHFPAPCLPDTHPHGPRGVTHLRPSHAGATHHMLRQTHTCSPTYARSS